MLPSRPRRWVGQFSTTISTAPPPLAAEADALEETQADQEQRRGDADLLIGRKQADQEGADAHHHDRDREHRLAADPVAVMTEDRSAQRPRQKADRVGAEGGDGSERGIAGREEDPVEHQRGRRAVDEEIVHSTAVPITLDHTIRRKLAASSGATLRVTSSATVIDLSKRYRRLGKAVGSVAEPIGSRGGKIDHVY